LASNPIGFRRPTKKSALFSSNFGGGQFAAVNNNFEGNKNIFATPITGEEDPNGLLLHSVPEELPKDHFRRSPHCKPQEPILNFSAQIKAPDVFGGV
jgi:hypothetical protein